MIHFHTRETIVLKFKKKTDYIKFELNLKLINPKSLYVNFIHVPRNFIYILLSTVFLLSTFLPNFHSYKISLVHRYPSEFFTFELSSLRVTKPKQSSTLQTNAKVHHSRYRIFLAIDVIAFRAGDAEERPRSLKDRCSCARLGSSIIQDILPRITGDGLVSMTGL